MFIKAFQNRNLNNIAKCILDYSDKYSYSIYLSHYIFILGSLSLIGMTRNMLTNTVFAIICTVALGIGIEFTTGLIIGCKRKA